MSLPQTTSNWDRLLADDQALRAGVTTIAQRHGLAAEMPLRCAGGSLPVYTLGEHHVLKLYPPQDASHAEVEARVLDFVNGRLPLRTPTRLASGALDGWAYLLMSRLRGRVAVDVWPELERSAQLALCEQLGKSLAALHALDVAPLADLPPPRWPEFIGHQRASAVQRQRERGLAEPWLAQIDGFLDRWAVIPGEAPGEATVLLHTEVMREHLLVEVDDGRVRFGGLFDFEPAMLGTRDYEFASVGLFVACGDGQAQRRLLLAYGFATTQLDHALQCRFMAQALLHRYSNLPWYLRRLPCAGATTLEQLAAHWWALPGVQP